MGMLALAMFDTVTALNPVSLVWSIMRIPGPYVMATAAFGLAITAFFFCDTLIGLVLPAPFLGYVISGFVSLYFVAVAMRIMGLLYWSNQGRLGWFSR